MMDKQFVLVIIFAMNAAPGNAYYLYGPSPISCMPDFGNLLYSALCDLWLQDSTRDAPSEAQHPKYDKSSGTWTYDCPLTEGCQFGIEPEDADNCAQCLLGPEQVCDNWNGECGSGLVCKYDGPLSCSGICVWKDQFYSRELHDSCGEWHGECSVGLKCKYDEDDTLLMALYGCVLPMSGTCVTQEDFYSQGPGDICNDLTGLCAEGLQCQTPTMPFLPSTCVLSDEAPEDEVCYQTSFSSGPNILGLEVATMFEEDGDGGIIFEEIAIPIPFQDENNQSATSQQQQDEIMFEIIDAIEHAVPDILGQTDPEIGEFDIVLLGDDDDNETSVASIGNLLFQLDEADQHLPSNDTTVDATFEHSEADNGSLLMEDVFSIFDVEDPDNDESPFIIEFDMLSDEPNGQKMIKSLLG